MSLQSVIIPFLILSITIFKKGACKQPHPFHKPHCVYEIYNGKSRQASFQIMWHIGILKWIPLQKSKQLFG